MEYQDNSCPKPQKMCNLVKFTKSKLQTFPGHNAVFTFSHSKDGANFIHKKVNPPQAKKFSKKPLFWNSRTNEMTSQNLQTV